jgi:signal transduction histidine kinase
LSLLTDPIEWIKLAAAAMGVAALVPSILWPILRGYWRGVDWWLLGALLPAWLHVLLLPAGGAAAVELHAALTTLLLAAVIQLGRHRLGLAERAPALDRAARWSAALLLLVALSLGLVRWVADLTSLAVPIIAGFVFVGALWFGRGFALAVLPALLLAAQLADATSGWQAVPPLGDAVLHLLTMTGLAALALPDLRRLGRRRARRLALKARHHAETRLLGALARELRGPADALLSVARLLDTRELSAAARRDATVLLDVAQRVRDRADDLLELRVGGDAGQGAPTVAPFELRGLVEGTVRGFEAEAAARGLTLYAAVADHLPVWVEGDASRIAQVLRQLLRNAIVFTRRGEIRVDALPGEGRDEIRIEIVERAIGLGQTEVDNILRPLARRSVAGESLDERGGLGLPLARRIAESMGGRIGIDNDEDGAGRLWVSMTLAAATAPTDDDGPALGGRALSILVIEPDPVSRYAVSELLAADGHRGVAVASIHAAIEAGSAEGPFDGGLVGSELVDSDFHGAAERLGRIADRTGAPLHMLAIGRPVAPRHIRHSLISIAARTNGAQ